MTALAASNPRIKRLRRLSGRRGARAEDGVVVLEGPIAVGEALARGADVEGLYVEAGTAPDLVATARAAGVEVHEVVVGGLDGVLDTVTPRPVVAVARRPAARLDDLVDSARRRARPLLVLVDVRDPGNVGTIVRAAEAAGAIGVIATVGTADPFGPKAARASAGAILGLPVAVDVPAIEALEHLGDRGVLRVATVARAGRAPDEVRLAGAVALVLGGEAQGLGADLLACTDVAVTIPMDGPTESLNVAVAAAVLAFEAARQRRALGPRPTTDWTASPADDRVIGP